MSDTYRCANCGLTGERDDFVPAADLYERLEPGGLYTDVECASCGALAFPEVLPLLRFPPLDEEALEAVVASLRVREGHHRAAAGPMLQAPVTVEFDPVSVEKAVAAVEGAHRGIEDHAIRFLLDGLGVPDIRTLYGLVEERRLRDVQAERARILSRGVELARVRLRDEDGPLPASAVNALAALDEAAAESDDLYDAAFPSPPVPHAADH